MTAPENIRERLYCIVSDAFYDARSAGRTMTDAANDAADALLPLIDTLLREQREGIALNVVFDGPPGPESGRFIECETDDGCGVNAGEWIERDDGFWALRVTQLPARTFGGER